MFVLEISEFGWPFGPTSFRNFHTNTSTQKKSELVQGKHLYTGTFLLHTQIEKESTIPLSQTASLLSLDDVYGFSAYLKAVCVVISYMDDSSHFGLCAPV